MKILSWLLPILFLALFVKSNANDLRAGAAKNDVTPPLEMKFALGGYGARMSKPAQSIHDRIWAKAVVVADGTKKFAIITSDVLAVPPNVKPQVVHKLTDIGFGMENVMILPSHSHTSLDMTALNDKNTLNIPQIGIFQPELLRFYVAKLVQVIRDANGDLTPVKFGVTSATLDGMNRNRRGDGAVDKELTVARLDRENGKPLAVLVNWTAHPTLMDEHDMFVSGGWPGVMQRELEAWIGNGVIALYFNGAEGDQAPVRPEGASHNEQAEFYGRKVAIAANDLYRKIVMKENVPLSFNYQKINLPQRIAHPDFAKTGGAEYGLDEQSMQVILKAMVPEASASNAVRIGDLLIVGAPGELACQLGLDVKNKLKKTGISHPVIGGLANEWISYILSAEQYKRGGYESSVSFYGSQLGETIVNGMLRAAEALVK